MKLSIIVPVYNEAKTIREIIRQINGVKLPNGVLTEIVVVNDGSSDGTKEILKKISGIKVFHHRKNKGKGAAIRSGLKKSSGDIIIIQDADLEYNPNDYPKLLAPIIKGKAKVVYGTRLKNYPLRLFGAKSTPLVTHYVGNKLLTLFTNLLYGNGLTDMETCYKVFKRSVLSAIEIKSNRFEFEPEITAKILKKGIKIHEVPIRVKPRGYEEGKKITWKDGFIALWTLLKYRFVD